MTLVLPYSPDQIGSSSVFSGGARNQSMPCVFDGEALDFESALMTDWNSDLHVYETSADDFSARSPSDAADLKRKLSISSNESQSKKQRAAASDDDEEAEDPLVAIPMESGVVPSSSSSSSCSSSSSSSSSSSDDASSSTAADEEEYVPRRRGPQMWSSRQRWKDERKRVLKLSVGKLAEIEDPELCMHRSVVINNTVRRLHADIRGERQAKLRQRQQQRTDSFDFHHHHKISSCDAFDDSSCDEIFGISEDFLRVTIPDRRSPTPLPSRPSDEDSRMDTSEATTRDTDSATPSPTFPRRTADCNASPPRRPAASQCATQYRTSGSGRDAESSSFPPRVPILDSVVYHSLLASLESS